MVVITPVTYNAEEAKQIREVLVQPHGQLVCPHCVGDLVNGAAAVKGNHLIREVYCPDCHRCLMVRDIAEEAVGRR